MPEPGEKLDEHGEPFGVVLRVVEHEGCLELVVREYAGGGQLQIFVETDARSV